MNLSLPRLLLVGAMSSVLAWPLPVTAQESSRAGVERPALVWIRPVPGSGGEVVRAGDGGALISSCDSSSPRMDHRRLSVDGDVEIRYPVRRFTYGCFHDVAFSRAGGAFLSGYTWMFGVQARRPDGTVRWLRMFGEDVYPQGAPLLIRGRLWLTRSLISASDLVELDRRTGRIVTKVRWFGWALPVLAADSGPVVVDRGEDPVWGPGAPRVTWLDTGGAITSTASLPDEVEDWSDVSAAATRDGVVFVAGCRDGSWRVEVRTRSGGEWSRAAPADEPCGSPELTATPDGGAVIKRTVPASGDPLDGITTLTKLDPTGLEVWTHTLSPPTGQLVPGSSRPVRVDRAGRLVLAATYSHACSVGVCRRGMVEILDPDGTRLQTLVAPSLRGRSPHGTTLTDLAIGPERVYLILKGARDRQSALALDVPSVDG